MLDIAVAPPNTTQLLMGNEAIARGALEAGIGVATAYPGTPSSEIIGTLASVAKELNLYVEWSANEKVALEVAAAASFSGVRAICAMKQLGLNVALDFLANLNLPGTKSGILLVACDDPGGISSTNEQDSRHIAKVLDLPLLEPATPQEAKEMTKWAFELSEKISNICLMRSVTRISHARGNVVLGELARGSNKAQFDTGRKPYTTVGFGGGAPRYHEALHQTLADIRKVYESSPFNWYTGPEMPELLMITCGSGWLYSLEAIEILSSKDSVGILKLGTTWPLPNELVKKHLLKTERVLVVEETDAFLESNVKELMVDSIPAGNWKFYGKSSGHIHPFGELNPDIVIRAVANIMDIRYTPRSQAYQEKTQDILTKYAPPREIQFCAGCPHRPIFWAIKEALKLDGREGVVTGDIGCSGSAVGSTGFHQLRTMHSMGSGVGVALGLGKLGQFGFNQPVVAPCGDSTFFHAAMPALLDGIHTQSNFIFVFLDNSGTAMTGFQPHPGINTNAVGEPARAIDFESLCKGLGIPVEVVDSYDIKATTQKLLHMLQAEGGPRALVCRRECALIRARRKKPLYKVHVAADKCIGEACGCDRFCTRVFKCPGLIWDRNAKKARIDEAVCDGCGVCVDICPHAAIIREPSG
jgi:indolepyruvate ferredoxin oxidoreductase alpha subunit